MARLATNELFAIYDNDPSVNPIVLPATGFSTRHDHHHGFDSITNDTRSGMGPKMN